MKKDFLFWSAWAGIIVFVGDFLVTFVLGIFYPGYDHLKLVMSELGTIQSPVALWMNLFWILFGPLFVVFGLGVQRLYGEYRKLAIWAAILLSVFGLGAWTIGGLFPMDPGGIETTLSGKLHGIFGGLGYLALLFVPLLMSRIYAKQKQPRKFWVSLVVFVIGIFLFGLFLAAEDPSSNSLAAYPGLWQRLYLLVCYGYLGNIAFEMLRDAETAVTAPHESPR